MGPWPSTGPGVPTGLHYWLLGLAGLSCGVPACSVSPASGICTCGLCTLCAIPVVESPMLRVARPLVYGPPGDVLHVPTWPALRSGHFCRHPPGRMQCTAVHHLSSHLAHCTSATCICAPRIVVLFGFPILRCCTTHCLARPPAQPGTAPAARADRRLTRRLAHGTGAGGQAHARTPRSATSRSAPAAR